MAYSVPRVDRLSVSSRAGTHLSDAAVAVPDAKGRIHGQLDYLMRVYQSGGELGNFLYRKRNLVSIDLGVWETIRPFADRLEMIDHGRNEVYEVSGRIFAQCCQVYDAGIGKRVGLPIDQWTRKDAAGHVLP